MALTTKYTVTSVNDAGNGRVTVGLTEQATADVNGTTTYYTNNMSLNLSRDEAESTGFYPGDQFEVSISEVARTSAKKKG